MRDLKVGATVVLALWALGACGSCGQGSAAANGPTQAQLAGSSVDGAWQLTVTVDSYAGPAPGALAMKPGHRGVDAVWFVSRCPATGGCTLQLWGPAGPDPQKESYFSFYSSTTGLEGPPVSTPMTEAGASYSQAIPIGGFGGATCAPSQTVPRPEQRITLNVTGAQPGSSGWSATEMSGSETLLAGWGCGPGGFTGWTAKHLRITGTPG